MIQSYCCNQWQYRETTFEENNLPQCQFNFLTILFSFFVMSTLEGIVEAKVAWAPYRKLYSFIPIHLNQPVKVLYPTNGVEEN